MLISCLMPTFNRPATRPWLLNEAVQSFLLQDYPNKELIICNDTPDQELLLARNHANIKVVNLPKRFDTLGNKLDWMIRNVAMGEYLCRWDDDDISLPWRLSLSRLMLQHTANMAGVKTFHTNGTLHAREWRPENHWYFNGDQIVKETQHPGNTHIAAIWHRDILGFTQMPPEPQSQTSQVGNTLPPSAVPVVYPGAPCPSGLEDQTFTSELRKRGYPYLGTLLPAEEIFYLYRWGVSDVHLSGRGGGERMQQTYQEIGQMKQTIPTYIIQPGWRNDYVRMAREAANSHPSKMD